MGPDKINSREVTRRLKKVVAKMTVSSESRVIWPMTLTTPSFLNIIQKPLQDMIKAPGGNEGEGGGGGKRGKRGEGGEGMEEGRTRERKNERMKERVREKREKEREKDGWTDPLQQGVRVCERNSH